MRRRRVDMSAVRAATPAGVARVGQLERLGLPGCAVRARWQAGGPWQRLLPGVVLMQPGPPNEEQRLVGALAYAGEQAMLTGLAACRWYGLRRVPDSEVVHLLVAARRQPVTAGFALVERTVRLPEPVWVRGLPAAPPARAVLDGARRLRRLDQVRALLAEAVQRRLCTADCLRTELAAACRTGTALPRLVLAEIDDGVHSVAEAYGRELVTRSSLLPTLRWNVSVYDPHGRFIARPDAWADDVALAWEIDSYEFHLAPADYDRTLRRRAAMTSAGIVVAHTLPSRLRTEPDEVLAELEAAYRLAASRPTPYLRTSA